LKFGIALGNKPPCSSVKEFYWAEETIKALETMSTTVTLTAGVLKLNV
jgi:hypothetical protein